jgi:hypothetical protein
MRTQMFNMVTTCACRSNRVVTPCCRRAASRDERRAPLLGSPLEVTLPFGRGTAGNTFQGRAHASVGRVAFLMGKGCLSISVGSTSQGVIAGNLG